MSMRLDYLTTKDQINKVSEKELIEALGEVNKKNLEIRRSFKHPNDCNIRCSKHIHF